MQAGLAAAPTGVANYSFTYDTLGELTQRTDTETVPATIGLTETFSYDALDRLIGSAIAGGSSKSIAYDAGGNILTKSDVGTYSYGTTTRPHAVTSTALAGVTTATYAYDANGNMTSGAGRTVTWTPYNMVASIAQGTTTISYTYDADHNRLTQAESSVGTTTYLNDPFSGAQAEAFIGTATPTVTNWSEYLSAGGERVGVHLSYSNGAAAHTRYFTLDHLGSIAVVADSSGTVMERDSYDSWGKRRNPNGSDATGLITSVTTRGYTGQEHIQDVGLVNYNARIYDPALARFMSADPVVEDAYDPQALNPYSYARDNPLLFTDPTGMCFLGCFWKPIFHSPIFKAVAAIGVAALGNYELLAAEESVFGVAATASTTSGVFASATVGELAVAAGISGAAAGAIQSGTWQGALIGAGEGIAFSAAGDLGPGGKGLFGLQGGSLTSLDEIGAHGLIGGLASEAAGGNFQSGFLAAGFSYAFTPSPSGNIAGAIAGTAEAAVAGGVGSILGGDKFENGAITGAFGYLFNELPHHYETLREMKQLVSQYSALPRTDDNLVIAQAFQESSFNASAVGPSNNGNTPYGLLQVTGLALAQDQSYFGNLQGITVKDLTNPAINIQAGTEYMKYLMMSQGITIRQALSGSEYGTGHYGTIAAGAASLAANPNSFGAMCQAMKKC